MALADNQLPKLDWTNKYKILPYPISTIENYFQNKLGSLIFNPLDLHFVHYKLFLSRKTEGIDPMKS